MFSLLGKYLVVEVPDHRINVCGNATLFSKGIDDFIPQTAGYESSHCCTSFQYLVLLVFLILVILMDVKLCHCHIN